MARRPAIPVDRGRITQQIVTDRARLQCECAGCPDHQGRCLARQSKSHPLRSGLMAHLAICFKDHQEGNWFPGNLLALCQPCKKTHESAKPQPEPLRPEYGGSLFDALPAARRDVPTL